MQKIYKSLGLMSGTSGDGIDASIISSDGSNNYEEISNEYFQYDQHIYDKIHFLKAKINNKYDLRKNQNDIDDLEKEITLFHAKAVNQIIKNTNIDLIGFHGQTIYHNASEKISKQIGNAKLLSQLTKKNIIYNFRNNDLKNGGQGAPLAPVFHKTLIKQNNLEIPTCILNIGGISNITIVTDYNKDNFFSKDIGPGNCLIDQWVRRNNQKYDMNGELASKGLVNQIIVEQGQELFSNIKKNKNSSLDTNDFDISFARGLSVEDGSATLTYLTAQIISASINYEISKINNKINKINKIIICGGGRKNNELINIIKKKSLKNFDFKNIDDYGLNGDFIESQAFAFLSIRSLLKLPISFPDSTGCKSACTGGELIKY